MNLGASFLSQFLEPVCVDLCVLAFYSGLGALHSHGAALAGVGARRPCRRCKTSPPLPIQYSASTLWAVTGAPPGKCLQSDKLRVRLVSRYALS
jgi:hypothetical protein